MDDTVATRKFKLRSPVQVSIPSFEDDNLGNASSTPQLSPRASRPSSPRARASLLFPNQAFESSNSVINNNRAITPRRSLSINSLKRNSSITSPKRNSILSISAIKDSAGNTTAIMSPTSPRFGGIQSMGSKQHKSVINENSGTIANIMRSNSSSNGSSHTNSSAVSNNKVNSNEVSKMDYEEFKRFMLKEYGAKEGDDDDLEFEIHDDEIEDDSYECREEDEEYDVDYDYESYNNSSDLEQNFFLARGVAKSTESHVDLEEDGLNENSKNKAADINKRINTMKKKLSAIENRIDMADTSLNNDTKLVSFCLTVLANA